MWRPGVTEMIQPSGLDEALVGGMGRGQRGIRRGDLPKVMEFLRDPGGTRAQISSANLKVFPK